MCLHKALKFSFLFKSIKEIKTGAIIPIDLEICYGPGYPAIDTIIRKYYEGGTTPGIVTMEVFKHGPFGNVIQYENLGDTTDAVDNIRSTIHYHTDTIRYQVSIPDSIAITDITTSTMLRKRAASIDTLGNVSEIRQYDNTLVSKYNMQYDSLGNITRLTTAENSNSQRYYINYEYDTVVRTFLTGVEDAFGYQSSAQYNLALGKPTLITDITGNQMAYSYDGLGRIKTVTGPKELEESIPFTIRHTYWNDSLWPINPAGLDSLLWALTDHYDPQHPGNYLQTIVFCDRLGRVVQTKKDAEIFDNGNQTFSESRIVSGRVLMDEFSRAISAYFPLEDTCSSIFAFNPAFDDVNPTRQSYDILDPQHKYGFTRQCLALQAI